MVRTLSRPGRCLTKGRYALAAWLWVLIGSLSGRAQDPYSFCRPEQIQFTRQTYRAYNQNWSVAQNPRTRFMYFANSKGLVEYDGNTWRTYELPQKQKVRSVAVDASGRIFTGALGAFGYWQPGVNGRLTYQSLAPLVRDKSFRNEEIWNILITPQGILFQSFAFMYRYQNGRVQALPTPGTILFVRQVRDRLLLGVIDKGLYELRGTAFTRIRGSEFLGNETVNTLLPIGKTDVLIGTERAIYRYDGQQFRPFSAEVNAFMQQNRLNRGLLIGPDMYAFGTLLNGILVTTADGHIRYQFNQRNGLQNNTVLAFCQDADHNLWVGLDKGIDLIDISSPIRYFADTDSNLGTVYAIARHNMYLYLGTNQGVYYKVLNRPDSPFTLISETQGQVWSLDVLDDQLLCGHNRGTFWIDGKEATLLSRVTGGWALQRLRRYPDRLLQGTYTKLCVYQKDNQGKWAFAHTVDGFSAPVRQLEEDETGTIWVNIAPNQGLKQLRLSPDLKRVIASREHTDPAFQQATVNLCRVGSAILATSAKGVRQYDAGRNKFGTAAGYEQLGPGIRKLFPLPTHDLFILRQDGTLAYKAHNGSAREVPVRTNQWVDEYEAIVPLDSAYIALCRENGFALLPRADLPRLVSAPVGPPLVRSVTAVDDPATSHMFQVQQSLEPTALSFSHRQANLLFTFCTPYFTRPVTYSYWLENGTKTWSPVGATHQKEFSNLAAGAYILHVRSNLSAAESALAFEVRPPWYWTVWSKLVYGLLVVGLIWTIYRLHLRRVALKQDQLREKLEEKLRHQEEESQREIMLLQKEQLEQGIIQKSEELANSTMSLIQKNELLVELKDELDRVINRIQSNGQADHFQRINYLIDKNISSEKDWQLFEANFNKVHEQFLKHLIEHYPDLSQGDLKLSAYLRMNLSTKEIAQLMNITHRSVELKRYRLRKKLNLDVAINLSEFMIKY